MLAYAWHVFLRDTNTQLPDVPVLVFNDTSFLSYARDGLDSPAGQSHRPVS